MAAEEEAERLRTCGAVPQGFEADLDRRFERAAEAALRVPAMAERAARLRRLGRRTVPPRLRPFAWRAVRAADRLLVVLARRPARRGGARGRI